jgi:predicted enzyme related to lactoylglutathione lyase
VPRLNHLSLKCTAWTACRSFYEALGLTFVTEQHPGVPRHLSAELDGGGVLELHGPEGAGEAVGAGCRIGFAVADVAATVDALGKAGGTLHRAPEAGPWGLRAVVVDPDGRRVELTRER